MNATMSKYKVFCGNAINTTRYNIQDTRYKIQDTRYKIQDTKLYLNSVW